ncbi:BTAD domain-containing putative transcriptional regulator [Rhodococcoides kyotonense]|uniref:DNA-binding transcriptional activator of the SARP family n=1 Tax=Rhodococcoides kyotonense TaxID=398843 RepID=A0A239G264_9NOCA|nr:BTAD domain-containing putative transcriptional regulator [Rhodococcus kyotonensis]SNS63466.1 DNA-binding transcriptional activator of the SARP family [Rhodococcus kyotonensis]
MMQPPVTMRAFGPIRADVAEQPASLGSRGQRTVLARLVLARRRVVSTDLLIEDLWAGDPPPRALGALQVHVSNLRRALEPDRPPRSPATVLISAPPGYALVLPDESVDVWQFEHLVDAGRYTDALALWTDGPYREVADAPWAAPEVIRLEDLRRTAVERRASEMIAGGSHASVVADLEAVIAVAPDREESVRLLALALYRGGRQSDALATLRRSREYLADELGIDPDPALRTLESDILSHSVSEARAEPPRPVEIPAAPSPTHVPSVVNGRPDDLAALVTAADTAAASGFGIAWIGGEAGEGKSTLAALLATELRTRSWNVGWGRCPEVDGAPPGWAWSEALDSLASTAGMDDDIRSKLDPILPQSAGSTSPQPFWLGKWAAEYLSGIADRTPTLVVLDDVHRGDALTMSILRQLASDARGNRIFVVATYRSSEISDDLMSAWATLLDIPSTRLELAGLSPDRMAAVAEDFGLFDPSDETLSLLATRTEGNPLFVRELVRLIVSEGPPAARETVPTGIGDVLRRRLSRLPERTVTTLRRLSVLGREADLDTLLDMAKVDEDTLLDDLEPAVLAGLLTESDFDRVQFTHALVRDTLYLDLPKLRRRRMHALAFSVLGTRTPDDLALLAHHAALGATSTTALTSTHVIAAAARRAESLSSHKDALALWNSAVETLDLNPMAPSSDRLSLLIPLVASLARAANTTQARIRRQEAIDIAGTLDDRRALLEAVTSWRAPVIWHIREGLADDGLLRHVNALLAEPDTGDADRVRLLTTSVFEIEGLDSTTASAQATEAVTLAEKLDDPELLCLSLNAFGYIAFGPDHDDEQLARAEQLLAVATDAGLTDCQALAHFQLFLACNAVVDLEGAREHVRDAVRLASGAALTQLLGVLTIFGGLVDVLAGRYDAAAARYQAVADYMDEQGTSHGFEIRYIGKLAVAIATDDYTGVIDDFASLDLDLPVRIHNVWVLALARTGQIERAREIWAHTEPYQRDYYWRGMTAVRALAAAALNDVAVCRACYDDLLPYSGTFAGVDSGSLYCGAVDSALAATADVLGMHDAAAAHRVAAEQLVASTQDLLADPGWVDLR